MFHGASLELRGCFAEYFNENFSFGLGQATSMTWHPKLFLQSLTALQLKSSIFRFKADAL